MMPDSFFLGLDTLVVQIRHLILADSKIDCFKWDLVRLEKHEDVCVIFYYCTTNTISDSQLLILKQARLQKKLC